MIERQKIIDLMNMADAVRLGMSSKESYNKTVALLNNVLAGKDVKKMKQDEVNDNWQYLKRRKLG